MKSFSEEWEKIHSTQEWGRYPSETVIRFIARNYYKTEREKIKILDFGCGAGAHTWYLAREGFDVYAFDGSKSAVDEAEKYLEADEYKNVHFAVMDGAEIQYEKDFFDCVVDSVCIYANTKQNIQNMYKEVYDVLKTGGKLYTSCFGTKTQGYGTGKCIENGTYEDIESGVLAGRAIAHFFFNEELESTLKSVGFRNIVIDNILYTDNGVQVEQFIAQAEK